MNKILASTSDHAGILTKIVGYTPALSVSGVRVPNRRGESRFGKEQIVRRVLIVVTIAGGLTLVVLFVIAMWFYFTDLQYYVQSVLPTILIPFDLVALITTSVGVFLFMSGDHTAFTS